MGTSTDKWSRNQCPHCIKLLIQKDMADFRYTDPQVIWTWQNISVFKITQTIFRSRRVDSNALRVVRSHARFTWGISTTEMEQLLFSSLYTFYLTCSIYTRLFNPTIKLPSLSLPCGCRIHSSGINDWKTMNRDDVLFISTTRVTRYT